MSRSYLSKFPAKAESEIEEIVKMKSLVWANYIETRKELDKHGLVRSNKSPESEFSEWLVKTLLNGIMPYKRNNMFWDVETYDKKIQVKSISKSIGNNNGYRLQKSDRNNTEATHYAFVWFQNFIPIHVYLVDIDVIRNFNIRSVKLSDLNRIGKRIFLGKEYFL
jgi:hypothetical protein